MSMTIAMSKKNYLLLAAALGLGSIAGVGSPAAQMIEKAAIRPQQPRQNKKGGIFGGFDGEVDSPSRRRARHGWSPRTVQRMALKKRNQARHRAACRGSKRSRA